LATSTTSVPLVDGPHPDAEALDARLGVLRERFPRAVIDRYLDRLPTLGARVLLAPTAAVVGDVRLGDDVSIWYGAVVRADLTTIIVGPRSNIQDGSVVHVGDFSGVVIGSDTVVGHRAVLHGCTIGDRCLIGMQATVLDDAVIGDGSLIAAGALVTQETKIPPGSLVIGSPARVIRSISEEGQAFHRDLAAKYARLKENYLRDALRGG
jgi:carbonic anhydrase/acetyltransferase-like protein (isoleucine patch superfamily)